MEPIRFPQVNKTWAEDQPEYRPLPSYSDAEQTISCWQLTWHERFVLLLTGKLWFRQLNFGGSLQPQLPSVEDPWKPPLIVCDRLGWPIERIKGRWFTNALRLLVHGRRIRRWTPTQCEDDSVSAQKVR
jgi:hypothetical protein